MKGEVIERKRREEELLERSIEETLVPFGASERQGQKKSPHDMTGIPV